MTSEKSVSKVTPGLTVKANTPVRLSFDKESPPHRPRGKPPDRTVGGLPSWTAQARRLRTPPHPSGKELLQELLNALTQVIPVPRKKPSGLQADKTFHVGSQ